MSHYQDLGVKSYARFLFFCAVCALIASTLYPRSVAAKASDPPVGACESVASIDDEFRGQPEFLPVSDIAEDVEKLLGQAMTLSPVAHTSATDIHAVVLFRDEAPGLVRQQSLQFASTDELREIVERMIFRESCVSASENRHAQEAFESIHLVTGEFVAVGYSPNLDRIAIRSNLPREIVESALRLPAEQIVIDADSRYSGGDDAGERTADANPHYAGARITAQGLNCSSWFSLEGSGGAQFSATAAHCPAAAYSSGPHQFSSGSWAPNAPSLDARRLGNGGGQFTFNPRSYHQNNNTSHRKVISSGYPANGIEYCNLGQVSRRVCYTQYSANQSFTTAFGTSYNMSNAFSVTTILSRPGDSGGPVARLLADGLGARGMHKGSTIIGAAHYVYYHTAPDVTSQLNASVRLAS